MEKLIEEFWDKQECLQKGLCVTNGNPFPGKENIGFIKEIGNIVKIEYLDGHTLEDNIVCLRHKSGLLS